MHSDKGPLHGLRFVEMVGIGPGPLAAMILSDLGAEVIRIDRPEASGLGVPRPEAFDFVARGRRSVALDLRQPEGRACALRLIARADGLIEGFRPGVMERLGLGPEPCLAANPRLIYARLTGWGQAGPLARTAGHDICYLALTGVLDAIGPKDGAPVPPLNLVADYAGGTLMLVIGVLAALQHRQSSGRGQVVDAAMVDGVTLLTTALAGLQAAGLHDGPRGTNVLDGGAPYYTTYACADGRAIAVGAIEPKFRTVLLQGLGLDADSFPDLDDPTLWPEARARLAARFAEHDRAHWERVFEGSDACVAPVLSLSEAPDHPHNRARQSHIAVGSALHPAPAPRFSASQPPPPGPPRRRGADGDQVLADWGLSPDEIAALRRSGALIPAREEAAQHDKEASHARPAL